MRQPLTAAILYVDTQNIAVKKWLAVFLRISISRHRPTGRYYPGLSISTGVRTSNPLQSRDVNTPPTEWRRTGSHVPCSTTVTTHNSFAKLGQQNSNKRL